MLDVESMFDRRADNRWERLSVGDILERNTWSQPDVVALIGWAGAYSDEKYARLTYRQADLLANRVANGLLAHGLDQSDRVLLICENSVEAFVTKIAIAKAGLVCIPINPNLAPDVVDELIRRCDPRFVIADAELVPQVSSALESSGIGVNVTIPIGGDAADGSTRWDEFESTQSSIEPAVTIHSDDIWQILFTSGTTAIPKGVMQSHTYTHLAAFSFAMALSRGLDHENDLRLCCFLPAIYHVTDFVFAFPAFVAGGALVLGRRPDAAQGAAAVTRERATAYYGGSPQMLEDFARTVNSNPIAYDVSSVTAIAFGWSSIGQGLARMLRQICSDGVHLFEIFGQTESIACHRFVLGEFSETYRRNAPEVNYVGLPAPLLASAVVDLDGHDLRHRPGIGGETVYRSPAITAGYYLDEPATTEAFRDGWFHSGDVCEYDDNGLRIMRDRMKDIVKSGGENVSSIRVEAVLLSHPSVLRAAVVGLPHQRWGEAVTAVVVPADPDGFDPEDLLAYARNRLAGFERPKSIIVASTLPSTVGGKILKYKLRASHEHHYD